MARASGGLTRRINILADKSLLAAYTDNSHAVTERHLRAAIADSEFAAIRPPRRAGMAPYVGAALALGMATGAAIAWLAASAPELPAQAPLAQASTAKPAAIAAPAPPQVQPDAEEDLDFEDELDLEEEAEEAQPRLAPGQVRRLKGYSPAGQKLLAERITATRELLENAPDERYAIELFITDNSDPARMERFLMRARDWVPLAELFVIPMAGAGEYRLRVVFGEFAGREQALEAARRLPPRYQQAFRTTPRSFRELRSQIW